MNCMIPQYLDHIRYCQVCCRVFNPRIKNRLDFQFKITAISMKPKRIHDKTKLILYPPKYKLHNQPDPKHTYIRIYTSRHIIYYAMHWKVSATKEVSRAKGQIISECPYEIIVYPKIATKKFRRFLTWPLRRGQTKNFIKPIMLNNP